MLRTCLLIACCCLMPLAVAAETPACSQVSVSRASARVRALLATNNTRGMDLPSRGVDVARKTASQSQMADALAIYMRAVTRCLSQGADTHSIAGELIEHLAAPSDVPSGASVLPALPRPATEAEFENDPFAVHFLVTGNDGTTNRAGVHRHVAMLASYGPACGREGELGVFSQSVGGWRQDFAWTVPPFSLVAGQSASAQLVMGQGAAGQNGAGRNVDVPGWYVAFAAREPSCKQPTDWVRLTVLLKPRAEGERTPTTPEIALRDEFLADASNADPSDWMRISAEPGLLDVEFNGIHDASKQEIFAGRRTYRIAGRQVSRIEPVAFTPVEFVEIWLAAPWHDALSWTGRTDTDSLRQAHEELATSAANSPDSDTGKRRCCALFEAVHRCGNAGIPKVQRIEVSAQYPAYEQLAGDGQRYFLLRIAGSGFVMERVSSQPDGTCGGENLLRQDNGAP